jgi:hypothetical protein
LLARAGPQGGPLWMIREEVIAQAGGQAAEQAEAGGGIVKRGVFADDGRHGAALVRGEATEEVVALGDEEVLGDEGQELAKGGLEGDEGFVGVAGAGVDGGEEGPEVLGQVLGVGDELAGQGGQVAGREGLGVVTGAEGVEVAGRGAAAAGSELEVTMGTAAGVAAHGPVAAAGHLAGDFVAVSGHDGLLSLDLL